MGTAERDKSILKTACVKANRRGPHPERRARRRFRGRTHHSWCDNDGIIGTLSGMYAQASKGIGEQIAQSRTGSFGIGIGGMRQRAIELGGELRVTNVHPGCRSSKPRGEPELPPRAVLAH